MSFSGDTFVVIIYFGPSPKSKSSTVTKQTFAPHSCIKREIFKVDSFTTVNVNMLPAYMEISRSIKRQGMLSDTFSKGVRS